jgi:hypothetical protein
MKRLTSLAVILAVAMTFSLAIAGEAAKEGEVTYTGWITDEWCGKKNANAGGKDCAVDCYKKGAKLVLYVGSEDKSIVLDNQEQASKHVGVEVMVTGVLEGKTLKVASIKEVEKG